MKYILFLMVFGILITTYSYGETLPERIKRGVTSYKNVAPVYIKPGNVTVLHFQSSVVEWYLGDDQSYSVKASEKSPENIAIKTTKGTAIARTNLIVKVKNQYYYMDLIPSITNYQDFYDIKGVSYRRLHTRTETKEPKKRFFKDKGLSLSIKEILLRSGEKYMKFEIVSERKGFLKGITMKDQGGTLIPSPVALTTKNMGHGAVFGEIALKGDIKEFIVDTNEGMHSFMIGGAI